MYDLSLYHNLVLCLHACGSLGTSPTWQVVAVHCRPLSIGLLTWHCHVVVIVGLVEWLWEVVVIGGGGDEVWMMVVEKENVCLFTICL